MKLEPWVDVCQKYTICIDSYQGFLLKGRVYNFIWEKYTFTGLLALLVKMESWLDEQRPQSYNKPRKLCELLPPEPAGEMAATLRKGQLATFEIQVAFRQHSSWQGTLIWRETGRMIHFRSVLELSLMIDSALRGI